jgi:hypothetical protein
MSRLPCYIGAVAFTRSGWPDVKFYKEEILKRVGGPATKKAWASTRIAIGGCNRLDPKIGRRS